MKKLTRIISALSLINTANAAIIHTSNIITTDNQESEVYLWLNLGKLENDSCHIEQIIQPTISLMLQTGDSVPVDGNEILQFAGPGFTCATLNFQRSEQARSSDYFILKYDEEKNVYTGSLPFAATVRIN